MTDQLQILIEEWKQNVALYIDQDKRGMERTKIFLLVHAGLLTAWGIFWKVPSNIWSMCAGLMFAFMGIFFTCITLEMSRRAHAFILLRKTQAMLIEGKIKNIVAKSAQWKTSSGIITTFTREHISFRSDKNILIPDLWKSLIEEVKDMDPYALRPLMLEGEFQHSIGHLCWLKQLHYALYALWAILGFLTAGAYWLS